MIDSKGPIVIRLYAIAADVAEVVIFAVGAAAMIAAAHFVL